MDFDFLESKRIDDAILELKKREKLRETHPFAAIGHLVERETKKKENIFVFAWKNIRRKISHQFSILIFPYAPVR